MSGRYALRDDGRLRVTPYVNHLRPRVGHLVVVGDGHTVELCLGIVAAKHTRGIFPSDGRPRLYLRPGELTVDTAQVATLGDEVQHTSLTLLVAGIPVLNGRVLHFGTVLDNNLDNGGVQLVLIAHRGGTPFEIRDVGIIIGYNERTLKLTGISGVDAEIAAQFHGTADALGDIDEGTVAENGGIERGKEIVTIRHNRT